MESAQTSRTINVSGVYGTLSPPHAGKVDYSITHALPGKVGFCIPRMTADLQYVRCLQNLLHQESRAIAQQIDLTAGSIVITYKQGSMTDPEMRSHLAILIQAAARVSYQ